MRAKCTAFFYTSYAVYLSVRQPERLLLATKWLYPEVAAHYAAALDDVERGIELAAETAWSTNPELLQELAHGTLAQKPNAAQFLAALTGYFSGERIA